MMLKWFRRILNRAPAARLKIEEETCPLYHPSRYLPVRIGNVLNERYKIVGKLGYGQYSTVWMARDSSAQQYVALKVLTSDCYGGNRGDIGPELFEKEILEILSTASPANPGHDHVTNLLDSFRHSGPTGEHVCFTYKPMSEGLDTYQKRFRKWRIPQPLMKRIARQLLLALDYAHSCDIIHCDIGEKNILIEIEDDSTILDYLSRVPEHFKEAAQHPDRLIPSTSVKVPQELLRVRIRLMDWGAGCFGSKHLIEEIYPQLCRPPEVMLDVGWDSKVDIWALGLLIWRIFETMYLFDGTVRGSDDYDTDRHLRQMVHYLGPPSKDFLSRGKLSGRYFDDQGNPRGGFLKIEQTLEAAEVVLQNEDKDSFLAFITSMLRWDPKERKTAKELLEDKWLNTPDTAKEIELWSKPVIVSR